jgi:hypothetical protein
MIKNSNENNHQKVIFKKIKDQPSMQIYLYFRSGQPTQIEYLPAEHTLDAKVHLVIEYKGRPTTTIAVGDELTFKLMTHDGENLVSDIFASNVIAKDPYTQRTIELIDRNG